MARATRASGPEPTPYPRVPARPRKVQQEHWLPGVMGSTRALDRREDRSRSMYWSISERELDEMAPTRRGRMNKARLAFGVDAGVQRAIAVGIRRSMFACTRFPLVRWRASRLRGRKALRRRCLHLCQHPLCRFFSARTRVAFGDRVRSRWSLVFSCITHAAKTHLARGLFLAACESLAETARGRDDARST
jgi:hypothetical protein